MNPTGATGIPSFLKDWFESLRAQPMREVVARPSEVGVFCADMTVAFCKKGNLASERVGALVQPVARILTLAHAHSVHHFVLTQDAHSPEAPEFQSFPEHALRGSDESQTVPELLDLGFSNEFMIIRKNSLHPAINTVFDRWLHGHPGIRTAIVVGNCTDFCVYQLAMYLRMRANAFDVQGYDVIVPASGVDTYDAPADGQGKGALPHPADFFHQLFLYHMALNGIRIVRDLT